MWVFLSATRLTGARSLPRQPRGFASPGRPGFAFVVRGLSARDRPRVGEGARTHHSPGVPITRTKWYGRPGVQTCADRPRPVRGGRRVEYTEPELPAGRGWRIERTLRSTNAARRRSSRPSVFDTGHKPRTAAGSGANWPIQRSGHMPELIRGGRAAGLDA